MNSDIIETSVSMVMTADGFTTCVKKNDKAAMFLKRSNMFAERGGQVILDFGSKQKTFYLEFS